MIENAILRQELEHQLTLRQAHYLFEDAVKDFPEAHINTRIEGLGYSFWHLVEHLRITQWDLLDYIQNPNYKSRKWPGEYWPNPDQTTDLDGWHRSCEGFLADRAALVAIIRDPATDLTAQIAHGQPGHTVLREVLIAAQHNAYHIGELAGMRGHMNLWKETHG